MSISRVVAAGVCATVVAMPLAVSAPASAVAPSAKPENCTGVYTEALVVEGMTCDEGWKLVASPQVRKAIQKNRPRFIFKRLTCTAGTIDVGNGYWVACHDRKNPARRWFSLASA